MLAELQHLVQDQVPQAPFDAVGFGWNAVDGEAVITVAYRFASAGEAARVARPQRRLVASNIATGDVVPVSLTIPDRPRG